MNAIPNIPPNPLHQLHITIATFHLLPTNFITPLSFHVVLALFIVQKNLPRPTNVLYRLRGVPDVAHVLLRPAQDNDVTIHPKRDVTALSHSDQCPPTVGVPATTLIVKIVPAIAHKDTPLVLLNLILHSGINRRDLPRMLTLPIVTPITRTPPHGQNGITTWGKWGNQQSTEKAPSWHNPPTSHSSSYHHQSWQEQRYPPP